MAFAETEIELVDSLNWISLPSVEYDTSSWSSWSSRGDPSFTDSLFPDLLDDDYFILPGYPEGFHIVVPRLYKRLSLVLPKLQCILLLYVQYIVYM